MMTKKQKSIFEEIVLCEGHTWSMRNYNSLTEEAKSEKGEKIVTRLFKDIKNKALKLDFSDIEVSKGDITKINNYEALDNAIKFLNKMSNNIKSPAVHSALGEINMAHASLKSYKNYYKTAFNSKNRLVIYLFDSVTVALVQATSYIVSRTTEILVDGYGNVTCTLSEINNLPKNASLSALKSYNQMDKDGSLIKTFNYSSKTRKEDYDETSLFFGHIGTIFLLPVYVIRWVVFSYYQTRIRLSAYFSHLADFVAINSTIVEDKKVAEKQKKIASRFKKMADKISVDQDMSTEQSSQEIKQNNKEVSEEIKSSDDGSIF